MKFAGFISYSWTQKAIAYRVHRQLEKYLIPRELRGRPSNLGAINKTLGTFFLDRAELSATKQLSSDIAQALGASRFLIVLCSPDSAQSEWVQQEIAFFERAGRSQDIIPVLVGGEPMIFDPRTSPNGAFPVVFARIFGDALPLAPDLRPKHGRPTEDDQLALLQIIGGLLGIGSGELSQRQLIAERRRTRRRNHVIAGLVSLLFLATVAGTTAWLQKRLADHRLSQTVASAARQVSASAEYVDRFQVPTALLIELLDKAEEDFTGIFNDAGDTPALAFQRAKYNLSMAELMAQINGNKRGSAGYLHQAGTDLVTARNLASAWYAPVVYHAVPDTYQIDAQDARALDFATGQAAEQLQAEQAINLAERALRVSQRLSEYDADAPFDVVFSTCLLADTHYRLGARAKAKDLYDQCTADARSLWDNEPSDNNRRLLLQAMVQFGVIGRLDADFLPTAEKLHQEASRMAEEFLQSAPETVTARELATEAFVSLAETLNLRGAPYETQLAAYDRAMAPLDQLIESDHDRLHWQVQKAGIHYRMAAPRIELAGGRDAPVESLWHIKDQIDFGVKLFQPMAADDIHNIDLQRQLTAFLETRAVLFELLAPHDGSGVAERDGRADIAKVLRVRADLAQRHPDALMLQRDLANANLIAAQLFVGLGDSLVVVRPYLSEARSQFQALAQYDRFQPSINRDLALLDHLEADLHLANGDGERGCALMQTALQRMRDLAAIAPEVEKFGIEAAEFHAVSQATCSGNSGGD